jgi:uracil-DNA glycosylase
MNVIATQISARDASSLIGWWAEMGVDTFIDEAPVPWLSRVAAKPVPVADVISIHVDAPVAQPMPTTLAEFTHWLMTADIVADAGNPARRIAPSGDVDADVMVLIDMPEASDHETLLSGDAGILFDKMLSAIGLNRSGIYLASVTPARPPSGMIDENAMPRLSEIALHHVKLVAPKSLWLLGRAPSRAITGLNEIEARGRLHKINHDGGTIDAMASLHPRNLLQNPGRKASVWADMLMLFKG